MIQVSPRTGFYQDVAHKMDYFSSVRVWYHHTSEQSDHDVFLYFMIDETGADDDGFGNLPSGHSRKCLGCPAMEIDRLAEPNGKGINRAFIHMNLLQST